MMEIAADWLLLLPFAGIITIDYIICQWKYRYINYCCYIIAIVVGVMLII